MIDFETWNNYTWKRNQPTNQPTGHWQEQKSAVILGIGNPLLDISAEVSQELKSHLFFLTICGGYASQNGFKWSASIAGNNNFVCLSEPVGGKVT